jgi:hypothetical protein
MTTYHRQPDGRWTPAPEYPAGSVRTWEWLQRLYDAWTRRGGRKGRS